MAKFTIEYDIHLGDLVSFTHTRGNGVVEAQQGIVQDISQLPDVFVEGFRNEDNTYTRWRKDISSLTVLHSTHEDYGTTTRVEFEKNENVEFVHKGDDVRTKEFHELIYRKLGENFK